MKGIAFMANLHKPRVLLIGGNGFIGSHLVDKLLLDGYRVRVLDRQPELFRQPLDGVEYRTGSFADLFMLREAIEDCEILIHLAHSTVPSSSLNHPEEEVLDSVGAFVNMINCFKNKGIRRIVYFSSGGAVYGNPETLPIREEAAVNPISPYGVAKLMIEKYLYMFSYLYGLEYIIVRPSNPFGPRQNFRGEQGVIPIFINKILNNEVVEIWGDGKGVKDYLYVEDLAKAVVGLINRGFDRSAYNISSGVGRNLNMIIEKIGSMCGCSPRIEYISGRLHDVNHVVLSSDKIFSRSGWRPATTFEDGLSNTIAWIEQTEKRRK
jgi:UDP-glucose 4-epimerase